MPARLLTAAFLLILATQANAQDVDAGKLRGLIRMPRLSALVGIGFNSERGITLDGETADHSAEIAALEKALCREAGMPNATSREDAGRYYQLSQLYDDDKKREQAAARAVELFTQQVRAEPQNARLAMQLGLAFGAQDKDAEAEQWLRKATRLSPGDSECWQSLGDFLFSKSLDTLMGRETQKGSNNLAALLQVVSRSVPPERVKASLKIAREAATCFDRAVTAAPRRPQTYLSRGFGRGVVIVLEEFGPVVIGKKDTSEETIRRVVKRLAAARILQDVQKAAELDPTSPRAQAAAGICEVGAAVGEMLLSRKEDQDAVTEVMECQARVERIIDRTVARLQGLTNHKEPRIAADACYLAGVLVLFTEEMLHKDNPNLENVARVEQWLRRSVELVPGNQSAWDWLCGTLIEQDKKKELREVCEARLRVADTARNRCWAARAYLELDQLDRAEKMLRAGLRLDEKSTLTQVSLAAALLKRGDRDAVAEAGQCLDRAERLLSTSSENGLAEDVALLRAVHAALNGNPAEARQLLRAVLERNKDHATAAKMLQTIGN
jgi:tetratricopeptide (TPR) repeat protein